MGKPMGTPKLTHTLTHHGLGTPTRIGYPYPCYCQVIAEDNTKTGGTAVTPVDELATSQNQWDKDERSAKSLLTQKIRLYLNVLMSADSL